MFVTYTFWTVLEAVHKGGIRSSGGTNYQLTFTREHARTLHEELKKEFG